MAAGVGTQAAVGAAAGSDQAFEDALWALVNLGYQRNAAEKALQQVMKDGADINVQKLLRLAAAAWRGRRETRFGDRGCSDI